MSCLIFILYHPDPKNQHTGVKSGKLIKIKASYKINPASVKKKKQADAAKKKREKQRKKEKAAKAKEAAKEAEKAKREAKKKMSKDELAKLKAKEFSEILVQSVNYFNCNHVDVNDGHICITTWTYTKGNCEGIRNAYLVFPDVRITYKDKGGNEVTKALAIPLVHGMMVEWDGRILRHCTTVLDIDHDCDNEIVGTFFCVKK